MNTTTTRFDRSMWCRGLAVASTATWWLFGASAHGQTLEPPFCGNYSYIDLGCPNGVLAAPPSSLSSLGGLFVRADDPDFLLIGGASDSPAAKIYKIGLVRDVEGHITSFAPCDATVVADAPGSDCDPEYCQACGAGGGNDGGLAQREGNDI